MHALAKFGLLTMLVTLAVLPNVLVTLSALPGANAQVQGPQPEALDWQTFLIPEFGTTVEYPAGIFSVPDGRAEKGIGQHFNSDDGRSLLTIYTRENEADDTPASYLKNNLRVGRAALDYERVTRSFFAISSTRQGLIFYSRCNFSSDAGGAIHCLDLVYPQAEKRAWDGVVTRISRSLRPLGVNRSTVAAAALEACVRSCSASTRTRRAISPKQAHLAYNGQHRAMVTGWYRNLVTRTLPQLHEPWSVAEETAHQPPGMLRFCSERTAAIRDVARHSGAPQPECAATIPGKEFDRYHAEPNINMYSNLNYIRLYDVLIDEIQRNSVAPGPGVSLRIRVETLGLTGGLF